MSKTHYERLSFLDSTFLAMEDRNAHFHVAGVLIFESGTLAKPNGGIDVDRVRAFVESRLHLIPRYRQVLGWVPLEGHPVWVDDPHFDLDYHVRHIILPPPGGEAELKKLAARIFGQKLDRFRPLWELWIVEGVQEGHFAIIAKVHHCMIDGIASVDMMKVLMNLAPTDQIDEPVPYEPRPGPTVLGLLRDEVWRRARSPIDVARMLRGVADDSGSFSEDIQRRLRAMNKALGSGWLSNASPTLLNPQIGPNRRFDWTTIPLDDVKFVKNSLGGTVNDVILATAAGAVRSFFLDNDQDPADLDFRIMAPVSVRTSEHDGLLGNQVAMWLLDLPIGEPDPVERLERIKEATAELKRTDQALGAALLVQATSWTPSTLLTQAARLAGNNARPFNLTVTNVPGPQIPVYLLGAKLVVQYPMVPLWTNHALGMALFSYNGEVAWGLNADADSIPSLTPIVANVQDAFAELSKAAQKAVRATQRKARRKAASPKKVGSKSRPARVK